MSYFGFLNRLLLLQKPLLMRLSITTISLSGQYHLLEAAFCAGVMFMDEWRIIKEYNYFLI